MKLLSWAKNKLKSLKFFDILLWAGLLFVLVSSAPMWIKLYQKQGATVETMQVVGEKGAPQSLPLAKQRHILIFWATWCPPCTLELSRFNEAVIQGEIAKDKVVAVSFGEDPNLVFSESKSRAYQFTVVADPTGSAAQTMEVSGTPTVYHIDENAKIAYASSGVSPLAIARAKSFLKGEAE